MYVLMNPLKPDTADSSLPATINWDFAQKEIAQVKGFATGSAGLTKGIYVYMVELYELQHDILLASILFFQYSWGYIMQT